MTIKKLEEIFWRDGKWVNEKGKGIKPEPIELPETFNLKNDKMLKEDPIFEKNYLETKSKEINAYSKKVYFNLKEICYDVAIQFYKI